MDSVDPVDFAAEIVPSAQGPVDRAYHYIAGLIDLKQVPDGGLLPTAEVIAKTLGLSRPTVLNAFSLLQAQGFVRVGTGRAGIRVAEPVGTGYDARMEWAWRHRDVIAQMAKLRKMVEPGVMRTAAEHGLSTEAHAEADRLLEVMSSDVDRYGYLAADTRFHALLASASQSPVIERLALLIRRWTQPMFDLITFPPDRREQSHTEHIDLLAAIKARDPEQAEAATHRHIAASAGLIRDLLDDLEDLHPTTRRREAYGQVRPADGQH